MTSTVREKLADELHGLARRKFKRRSYTLKGINDLIQADLVDLQSLSKFNSGYKYLLTAINCFTKYAYAIKLKTKTASEVANALKLILNKNLKIKLFQTDQGREFFNNKVSSLLEKYNIKHYFVYSELKASIVERFNRTLKSRLFKHFTATSSNRWIDCIDSIVRQYNNTYHTTIKMKPAEVKKKHEKQILAELNRKKLRNIKTRKIKPKFKIDDIVRISKYKNIFDKSYNFNWTPELFRIISVFPTIPITYQLEDLNSKLILGRFYEYELKKTCLNKNEREVYLVEKILKKSGNNLLVKWLGFSAPSWINKKDLLTD